MTPIIRLKMQKFCLIGPCNKGFRIVFAVIEQRSIWVGPRVCSRNWITLPLICLFFLNPTHTQTWLKSFQQWWLIEAWSTNTPTCHIVDCAIAFASKNKTHLFTHHTLLSYMSSFSIPWDAVLLSCCTPSTQTVENITINVKCVECNSYNSNILLIVNDLLFLK